MAAAAAVFGQRGKRDAALVLREEGERSEGVVELAGWFQASQGREKKRGRSAGSARRRRGASAFLLDVRARGQCRVARSNGLEGAGLGEPSAGEVAWPGRRRVAGGLAHGRRWTGEGREQREEREN